MNQKTRGLPVGGFAVVLVAATIWVIVGSRRADRAPATRAASSMPEMEGMAGMNMSSDGSVRLTANQISQFGITFGTVEMRTLDNEVRTVGIVNFDETRLAQVAPKFGGFVERLHADFTGQPIQRGQPLLEIYSPELVAAQEELLIARRLERTMDQSLVPGVPAGSSNLLAAAKRRLQLWDISEAQVDEILRSGEVQRTLTIHAPASGVVVEKNVVEGQATQPGQTLYTIANLSEVWVEAEVREADAGRVRVGSGANIELAAFPGRPFKGRVEYVYPTLQAQSRTLKARVAVANPDGRLKPGMYATVRITTATQRALTVPASAVMRTGERTLVFVDMGGGRLMPQEVETGRTGEAYIEILSGVEPGQRVVTSAQFLLDSESNLGEVMKSMIGMGGEMGDMKGMDMSSGGAKEMDMPVGKGADVKGAIKEMPGMRMPQSSPPPQR